MSRLTFCQIQREIRVQAMLVQEELLTDGSYCNYILVPIRSSVFQLFNIIDCSAITGIRLQEQAGDLEDSLRSEFSFLT